MTFRGTPAFTIPHDLRGSRDYLREGFHDLTLIVDNHSSVPSALPRAGRVRDILSGARFRQLGIRLVFVLRGQRFALARPCRGDLLRAPSWSSGVHRSSIHRVREPGTFAVLFDVFIA